MGDVTKDLTVRVREQGARETEAALNNVDKASNKVDEGSKSLGTRLAENKEKFSALGGAAFAATSALQATSGGLTQVLAGAGAVTGALSAVPGPVGAISAGFTALLGVGAALSTRFGEVDGVTRGLITTYDALADKISVVEGSFSGLGRAAIAVSAQTLKALAEIEARQSSILTADQRRVKLADEAARPALVRAIRDKESELLVAGASGVSLETRQSMGAELEGLRQRLADVDQRLKVADQLIAKQAAEGIDAERRQRALVAGETARIEAELTPLTDRIAEALGEAFGPLLGSVGGQLKGYKAPKAGGGGKGAKPKGGDDYDDGEGFGPTVSKGISGLVGAAFEAGPMRKLTTGKQEKGSLDLDVEHKNSTKWAEQKKRLEEEELKRSRELTLSYVERGQAATEAGLAAVLAGESVVGAITKQLNADARAAVLSSGWEALKYGALSVARYAMGDVVGGSLFAQAAGGALAYGAAAAAVAGATGGFGSGGGGGSTGNESAPASVQGVRDQSREREAQSVVINLSLNGPAPYSLADQKRWSQTVAQGVKMAQSQRGARI